MFPIIYKVLELFPKQTLGSEPVKNRIKCNVANCKICFNKKKYACHAMLPVYCIYLIEETLSEKEHRTWMMRYNRILGTRQNELLITAIKISSFVKNF